MSIEIVDIYGPVIDLKSDEHIKDNQKITVLLDQGNILLECVLKNDKGLYRCVTGHNHKFLKKGPVNSVIGELRVYMKNMYLEM